MRKTFVLVLAALLIASAAGLAARSETRIVFLHHSTGQCIWDGGMEAWFESYNGEHGTGYRIEERIFPTEDGYGWNNYPYDYWNIWVKHAGTTAYQGQPTLEMLAKDYNVIVWKHCFPVSNVEPDSGWADIASDTKSIENYKLQYAALKEKMRSFPQIEFVVWTGAALIQCETCEEEARRARDFFTWVKDVWDEPGDNIFIWDFHELETEGGLYFKDEYASGDSHPNEEFSRRVAPFFGRRVVDVIEGRGDGRSLAGK